MGCSVLPIFGPQLFTSGMDIAKRINMKADEYRNKPR